MRAVVAEMPQYDFPTEHFFHGGMYVRTVKMPASSILCGAVIKVPTLVTVAGDCIVKVGEDAREIVGYAVLRGAPGRSQIFIARAETYITMSFPSKAKTLEEAEEEFTDEFDQLMSRRSQCLAE
jgi:hypothetical protein